MNTRIPLPMLLGAFCLFLVSQPANADIVFDMTTSTPSLADGLEDGDTVTAGGITMTFSNIIVSDGSSVGDVESAGILISSSTDPGFQDVVGFDISFDQDVIMSSYTIGIYEDVTAGTFFTLDGGAFGVSGNNVIPAGSHFSDTTLAFDSGTIAFFEAGEVYAFTHNLSSTSDSLMNLKSFSVNAVPEPGTSTVLLIGALGLVLARRRQKNKR